MPIGWGGFVGVDVFFVLSGYLITSILNREIASTGSIRLGRFYARRLRRLMPALLILIGAVFLIDRDGAAAARAMLYLNDLLPPVIEPLHHTWSLAVEEHYYLFWPLILLLIVRFVPRHALLICALLCLAAVAWRFTAFAIEGAADTYHRLDIRLGGLFLGSALALFVAGGYRIPRSGIWALCLAVLSIELLPFNSWDSGLGLGLGMSLAEGATAFVILSTLQGEGKFGFLTYPPLRFIGEISYGIYLFHCPIALWMTTHGAQWWTVLLVALPVSVALAALSYFLIERPIRHGEWPFRGARLATS